MNQKIMLNRDGVCVPGRMRPFVPSSAQRTPAVRLSRLEQLLKTHKPKICVVRGEGIGDVIMTTPTIHALKRKFKDIEISYATNTKYLGGSLFKVLQYNPDISEIVDRELLNDAQYDLVMNLHCPCVNFEKPQTRPPNRIDIFAQHAGVELIDPVPRYYPQEDEIESARETLAPLMPTKLMMVQPFASTERRALDQGKLKSAVIKLYQEYGVRSIIVKHSSDFRTDVLWNNVPGAMTLLDADVRRIGAIMTQCDMLLCPDSSLLHLGGALGVPTVSIFGPTYPGSRINHYKNAVAIWEGEKLAPCPCWYTTCPIGNACWASITDKMVVDAVVEHLRRTKKIDTSKLLDRNTEVTIETELI